MEICDALMPYHRFGRNCGILKSPYFLEFWEIVPICFGYAQGTTRGAILARFGLL